MSIYVIQADFGSGLEAVATVGEIQRKQRLHKNLKPTIDECTFFVDDITTANKFNTATTDIPIEITKDGTDFFVGLVQLNFRNRIVSTLRDTEIKAVDYGILLQKKINQNLQYVSFKLSDPTNKTSSILHQLFYEAGINDANIDFSLIDKVIDYFVVEKYDKKDYDKIIQKLLFEFGYVYYFDASGTAKLYELYPTSITAPAIDNDDTYGEIGIKRIEPQIKAIRVSYYPHEIQNGIIVFSDTTDGDSENKCNITLGAGDYYPNDSDTLDTYMEYQADDYEIIVVNNAALDIEQSGVATNIFTPAYKRALIQLYSSGGGEITKLDITGNAVLRDINTKHEVIKFIVADSEEIEDIETEYIIEKTDADDLAMGQADYYKYADFIYKFDGENYTLGAYKTLTESVMSITTKIRIVEIIEDQWGNQKITAEGVDEYTATSTTAEVTIDNPTSSAHDDAIIAAYSGTTTPAIPTIISIACRANSIYINIDRQTDLLGLTWYYEIQVSKDEISAYSLELDGSDWNDTLDADTDFWGQEFVHTNIPLEVIEGIPQETTLSYRVRRCYSSSSKSAWSAYSSVTIIPVPGEQIAYQSVDNFHLLDHAVDSIKLAIDAVDGSGLIYAHDEYLYDIAPEDMELWNLDFGYQTSEGRVPLIADNIINIPAKFGKYGHPDAKQWNGASSWFGDAATSVIDPDLRNWQYNNTAAELLDEKWNGHNLYRLTNTTSDAWAFAMDGFGALTNYGYAQIYLRRTDRLGDHQTSIRFRQTGTNKGYLIVDWSAHTVTPYQTADYKYEWINQNEIVLGFKGSEAGVINRLYIMTCGATGAVGTETDVACVQAEDENFGSAYIDLTKHPTGIRPAVERQYSIDMPTSGKFTIYQKLKTAWETTPSGHHYLWEWYGDINNRLIVFAAVTTCWRVWINIGGSAVTELGDSGAGINSDSEIVLVVDIDNDTIDWTIDGVDQTQVSTGDLSTMSPTPDKFTIGATNVFASLAESQIPTTQIFIGQELNLTQIQSGNYTPTYDFTFEKLEHNYIEPEATFTAPVGFYRAYTNEVLTESILCDDATKWNKYASNTGDPELISIDGKNAVQVKSLAAGVFRIFSDSNSVADIDTADDWYATAIVWSPDIVLTTSNCGVHWASSSGGWGLSADEITNIGNDFYQLKQSHTATGTISDGRIAVHIVATAADQRLAIIENSAMMIRDATHALPFVTGEHIISKNRYPFEWADQGWIHFEVKAGFLKTTSNYKYFFADHNGIGYKTICFYHPTYDYIYLKIAGGTSSRHSYIAIAADSDLDDYIAIDCIYNINNDICTIYADGVAGTDDSGVIGTVDSQPVVEIGAPPDVATRISDSNIVDFTYLPRCPEAWEIEQHYHRNRPFKEKSAIVGREGKIRYGERSIDFIDSYARWTNAHDPNRWVAISSWEARFNNVDIFVTDGTNIVDISPDGIIIASKIEGKGAAGTPSAAGLFLAADKIGLYDGGKWLHYFDGETGDAMIGDYVGGAGCFWDQSAEEFNIKGTLNAVDGSFEGSIEIGDCSITSGLDYANFPITAGVTLVTDFIAHCTAAVVGQKYTATGTYNSKTVTHYMIFSSTHIKVYYGLSYYWESGTFTYNGNIDPTGKTDCILNGQIIMGTSGTPLTDSDCPDKRIIALFGSTDIDYCLYAKNSSSGKGLYGESNTGEGIRGDSTTGYGVRGRAIAGKCGGYFEGATSRGDVRLKNAEIKGFVFNDIDTENTIYDTLNYWLSSQGFLNTTNHNVGCFGWVRTNASVASDIVQIWYRPESATGQISFITNGGVTIFTVSNGTATTLTTRGYDKLVLVIPGID